MSADSHQDGGRSFASINAYVAPVLAYLAFATLGHTAVTSSSVLYSIAVCIEACILMLAVFATLRHGETVAHWLGEPYGTIVLTMAVTIIEVSIIANLMLDDTANPELARQTLFSATMLICNGLVGLCLVYGAMHHREQELSLRGTNAYLNVLIAMSVLTLILPNYVGEPGASFNQKQLAFAALAAVGLYCAFLFIQTVRHPGFFRDGVHLDANEARPERKVGLWHLLWLLISVGSVVAVADRFSSGLEKALRVWGTPDAILGLVIALLVLLPEGLTALIAARANAIQKSLNIALGSALASIGLTIPAIAMVSLLTGRELNLGLGPRDTVLLMLTLTLAIVSFGTGRTNVLTGFVHLVIFAVYIFFQIVP
jgi:Ca2+:H+ antiporter